MPKPKSKPKTKSTPPAQNPPSPVLNIKSMPFWREVAQAIGLDDPDQISELATAFRLLTQKMSDEWPDIARSAEKLGGLDLSFTIKTKRDSQPQTVKISGGYGKRSRFKAESDVPDPNAVDLPGIDWGGETAPMVDEGAGSGGE
jgi:hypothetical protein